MIEGLALCVALNPDIPGVTVSDAQLKTAMYADDTTVIVQTEAKADAVMAALEVYCNALGARIDWNILYILHVGQVARI